MVVVVIMVMVSKVDGDDDHICRRIKMTVEAFSMETIAMMLLLWDWT